MLSSRFTTVLLGLYAVAASIASVSATPLAWDGGSSYSGASNSVNGGSVTGGGGIDLIKILSHNAAPAGETETGPSVAGQGGDRRTHKRLAALIRRSKSAPSGSGGGEAYSGAAGTAEGGSAETDPTITVLDLLSDNAAPGGSSTSGSAFGGNAGNIV